MTFKEIQDAVIADLFDETDRPDVKNWINARGRLLWGMDEWDFRRNTSQVTVTAGSPLVTYLPQDMEIAVALFRDDGFELVGYEEYREFANIYVGSANTWTGLPEAFSVIGSPRGINGPLEQEFYGPGGSVEGAMMVGPTSNVSSSTYLLDYERRWQTLVDDGDVPGFPDDTHMALVFAAKADGMVLKNILLNEPLEQRYQEYLAGMQRDWITAIRGAPHQTPAYRPGGGYGGGRWLEP